jgi:hypothetical protein
MDRGLHLFAWRSVQSHDLSEPIALLEGEAGAGVTRSCPHGSVPSTCCGSKVMCGEMAQISSSLAALCAVARWHLSCEKSTEKTEAVVRGQPSVMRPGQKRAACRILRVKCLFS